MRDDDIIIFLGSGRICGFVLENQARAYLFLIGQGGRTHTPI